ncbi:MAG: hypothetical protein AB8B99_00920 [Phormidesmis sp.]
MTLTLLLWMGLEVSARQQMKKMDAKADAFLQHPMAQSTTKNDSAQTLEQLVSKLGFGVVGMNDATTPKPDPVKAEEFAVISKDLRNYTQAQSTKVQGPLDPIPENLQAYLNNNQQAIADIEAYLRSDEIPLWDFDAETAADFSYAMPSFLSTVQLQRLLLLKAIDSSQQKKITDMVSTLEAVQGLSKLMDQRPELIGYLVNLISLSLASGTIRHLENVPVSVSSHLMERDQMAAAVDYLNFENWMTYKAWIKLTANPVDLSEELGYEPSFWERAIEYLPDSYLQLSGTDIAKRSDNAYAQLPELTVCSIASIEEAESQLGLKAPWWNVVGQVAMGGYLPQWQKGGQRMLEAELTHHVVQAKALAADQGEWPETLPNLQSATCPNETWAYEVTPNGTMTLSFSHSLDLYNAERHVPLKYEATLAQALSQ